MAKQKQHRSKNDTDFLDSSLFEGQDQSEDHDDNWFDDNDEDSFFDLEEEPENKKTDEILDDGSCFFEDEEEQQYSLESGIERLDEVLADHAWHFEYYSEMRSVLDKLQYSMNFESDLEFLKGVIDTTIGQQKELLSLKNGDVDFDLSDIQLDELEVKEKILEDIPEYTPSNSINHFDILEVTESASLLQFGLYTNESRVFLDMFFKHGNETFNLGFPQGLNKEHKRQVVNKAIEEGLIIRDGTFHKPYKFTKKAFVNVKHLMGNEIAEF